MAATVVAVDGEQFRHQGVLAETPITCKVLSSFTGRVLLEVTLDARAQVSALKDAVCREVYILATEQMLLIGGRPLCSWEFLCEVGESGPSQLCLDLRRVDSAWVPMLEGATGSRPAFEAVRRQLASNTEAALTRTSSQSSMLRQLAQAMKGLFSESLKKVEDSGNNLLVAAGDLQRNRDVVFDMVPRSSKGTRRAAEELRIYRESVLTAAYANGQALLSVQQELASPREAVLRCLRDSAVAMQNAMEALQREGELVQLGRARGWIFANVAKDLEDEYKKMLSSVHADSQVLEGVTQDVRRSCESYRNTIVLNRTCLRHASLSMKEDKEVVYAWAIDHVSQERKRDRDFIITVVRADGEKLEQVPDEFKLDREIVHAAVQESNGWALQHAGDELKRDKEIVLAAVRRNGWALEHAAPEMKDDHDVVLAAVQANGEALEHASERLKKDHSVVLAAVRRSNGWALQSAAKELRRDRTVVAAALHENGLVLESVAPALRGDKELVLIAVQGAGLALEYASDSMRDDEDVVRTAIKQAPVALKFASARLKADRGVVNDAVQQDGAVLECAAEELRKDHSLVLKALASSGSTVLEFAEKELSREEGAVSEPHAKGRRPAPAPLPTWSPRNHPDPTTVVAL